MLKAMLFVDADWLCASTLDLERALGKPDLQIDYRRMSGVLADEIGRRNHLGPIDVVRSCYFATRAVGVDPRDHTLLQRKSAFLARLGELRGLKGRAHEVGIALAASTALACDPALAVSREVMENLA